MRYQVYALWNDGSESLWSSHKARTKAIRSLEGTRAKYIVASHLYPKVLKALEVRKVRVAFTLSV